MDEYKITHKNCGMCNEIKHLSMLYKNGRCKDCHRAWRKEYYIKNKKAQILKMKEYNKENPEIIRKALIKYSKTAKGKESSYKAWKKNMLKPEVKIAHLCRSRIRSYLKSKELKKKIYKFQEYIGCSVLDLKVYIESKFTEGMTWGNQGKWHIDHIIPLSSAKTEEEIYKLCHYTNLQPLWAYDNISKGNKITKEKTSF